MKILKLLSSKTNLKSKTLKVLALQRLCLAALWSPAGKGLTSWLSFVMFNCVFVTIPCSLLGHVWYLIVSIPDICQHSYFPKVKTLKPADKSIISVTVKADDSKRLAKQNVMCPLGLQLAHCCSPTHMEVSLEQILG